MALGLFDRQAKIGLDVPEWLTIYLTEDSLVRWGLLEEVIEGAAIMGARGATVVLGDPRVCDAEINGDRRVWEVQGRIASYRPWFKLALCDEAYFRNNEAQLAAGRGLVIRMRNPAGPADPAPVPQALVGDWAVVMDTATTAVGKSADPSALLAMLDREGAESPWGQGHWGDPFDSQNLESTMILLALNCAAKPLRFQPETFFFASEFMDETVSRSFNARRLRARWGGGRTAAPQQEAAA
jgi:hypothetical protein